MRKFFIFFIISLFISACTLKKVDKHHGVRFLNKKQAKLIVNKSNKNDIIKYLGTPSTKSTFNKDLWIYIERRVARHSLLKLGKEKIITNNILLLEINDRGVLESKKILDLKNMNDVKFVEKITYSDYQTNTFIYEFLSSMRQKINDPLGKRKKK